MSASKGRTTCRGRPRSSAASGEEEVGAGGERAVDAGDALVATERRDGRGETGLGRGLAGVVHAVAAEDMAGVDGGAAGGLSGGHAQAAGFRRAAPARRMSAAAVRSRWRRSGRRSLMAAMRSMISWLGSAVRPERKPRFGAGGATRVQTPRSCGQGRRRLPAPERRVGAAQAGVGDLGGLCISPCPCPGSAR